MTLFHRQSIKGMGPWRVLFSVPIAMAMMGCQAPRSYECHRVETEPVIDGSLADDAWQAAAWTDDFVDIEGNRRPLPTYRTRAKMVWDDRHLYIAAELEEPHIWATIRAHDEIVFHDNDFEIFIDPDGDTRDYVEVELNAFGTVFDLLLKRTYRDGGPADHDWNVPGLMKAIGIDGTLNNPDDTDRAWVVEVAIPWTTFERLVSCALPPQPGDRWRINFSRVEWQHEVVDGEYRKVAGQSEANWVWSPQGEINMHIPERWGTVEFVSER